MSKKIIILPLMILWFPFTSFSQKVIHMENVNGVYRIACSVNGAKIKMIFDTGASKVSLSESMANFLYDNDYISKEDILGTSKTQTADGSIHNNVVINIKDIEISGLHLKNVQAVVISSQNAPLLLGQSAIQKLGRITLNGNKLIINDYRGDYSEDEINRILDLAMNYYNEGNYNASIDNLLKVLDYIELNTYGYYMLISSFFTTRQYDEVVKYTKEWERNNSDEEPSLRTSMIYSCCGTALSVFQQKHREALVYYEKSLKLNKKLGDKTGPDLSDIADAYSRLEEYDKAISYYKKAITALFKENHTSEYQIKTEGIDNLEIGICLYGYAIALIYGKNDINSGYYIMSLAARCNDEAAINYCHEHNIRYNRSQSLFE
jgi:clan AA aspartic protease (TIGR02281 family)